MFVGFGGGINGWGTICGTLVAPVTLISGVVEDKKTRSAMIEELMSWYIQFPFPEYQPAGLDLPKIAVGSTLCHISVSRWCNADEACVKASSKKKKERCAGVSADVTKKTIQMLNSYAENGTFKGEHVPDSVVESCMECHKDNPPYTSAKENCMNCHGEEMINIEECQPHEDMF